MSVCKFTQPKKISIFGDFWDCYLYRNRLFICKMDKTISIFNWKKSLEHNCHVNFGTKCAFLNSDYLYKIKDKELFNDKDFKKLAIKKINAMNDIEMKIKKMILESTSEFEQLFIDFEIYNNCLYYSDSSGFYLKELNFKNKNQIKKAAIPLRNKAVQNININESGRIALSLSSEGLYEFNRREFFYDNAKPIFRTDFGSIYKISDDHSTNCDWAFNSLMNFSYVNKSNLFPFIWKKDKSEKFYLERTSDISLNDLFKNYDNNSIYIAGHEKIYCLSKDGINGVNFYQNNLDVRIKDSAFEPLKEIHQKIFTLDENEFLIQAKVTDFGIVIETNCSLYVVESNNSVSKYGSKEDKVVKWRVYPRSNCYSNQLHIIFNNRLEIISFNNDCFIEQKDKFIGQKHRVYKIE